MALPIITLPIKKLILSDGKSVNYRPFTVREEKLLLLAKEEGDTEIKYDTVIQIITNCTFGELDVSKLKTIDVERLFVNIRCSSVGSQVTLTFICKQDTGDDKTCGGMLRIPINLENTEYPKLPDNIKTTFMVDDISIILKQPTLGTLSASTNNDKYTDIVFYINKIVQGDEVYESSDVTLDELEAFVDSVPLDMKLDMAKTIDRFPKAQQNVKYECNDCGNSGDYTIRGIESFFM